MLKTMSRFGKHVELCEKMSNDFIWHFGEGKLKSDFLFHHDICKTDLTQGVSPKMMNQRTLVLECRKAKSLSKLGISERKDVVLKTLKRVLEVV